MVSPSDVNPGPQSRHKKNHKNKASIIYFPYHYYYCLLSSFSCCMSIVLLFFSGDNMSDTLCSLRSLFAFQTLCFLILACPCLLKKRNCRGHYKGSVTLIAFLQQLFVHAYSFLQNISILLCCSWRFETRTFLISCSESDLLPFQEEEKRKKCPFTWIAKSLDSKGNSLWSMTLC